MSDRNDYTTNVTLHDENLNPVNIELHDGLYRLVANSATYKKGSDVLDALDDEIVIDTKGYSTVATYVTGTFVGEIRAYASVDGTNYFAVEIVDRANASIVDYIDDEGAFVLNSSGYMFLKLVMNPYTSGSANVAWGMALGGGIVESFGASGVVNTVVIRDRNNPAYEAEVDSQGRLKVSLGAPVVHTVELQWSALIGPPIKDMWQEVKVYTVPTGYKMEGVRFNCSAANSTSWARACIENKLAEFDLDTDVYTDLDSIEFPGFAAELSLEVLADVGGNATLTITYTNELNVTGRTATYPLNNALKTGHIYQIPLQGDDNGIRDITNITVDNPTIGGDLLLVGYVQMFIENMTTAAQMYTQFAPREAIVLQEEDIVVLQYRSGQTATVDRVIQFSGTLVPI